MESDNWSPLDWATYYTQHGLVVIPAMGGRPTVDWKSYQTEPPTADQVQAWFRGESFRKLQAYVVCGRVSGVVVLDCDSIEAEEWWRELLGPDVLDHTARSLSGSGRGHHYWFRLGEEGQDGRSAHRGEMKWDLRAEGGGVVVPPSPHKSGGRYAWEIGLENMLPWPYPEIPGKGNSSHEGDEPSSSSLAWLLAHPGDGGRNNWVTAVLGHYAKNLNYEDGYIATAEMVWALASSLDSDHPYDRDEFERTRASVWGAEKEKYKVGKPDPDSGWLVGDGRQMFTLCKSKGDGETVRQYAQFDIKAKSMIIDAQGQVSYVVDVFRDMGTGIDPLLDAVLPGDKLGSSDGLAKWMASRRMIVNPPAGDVGQTTARPTRFQMYLERQNPRKLRAAPWMGWYEDAELGTRYVTEQGLIDKDGVLDAQRVGLVPDPRKMTGESNWWYGFDDGADHATAALREVLSFHDPVVCSLFGALWSLAPIKGGIMKVSSLFPHMAIIAPSEAGKTNGFFDLMLQANGRLSVGGTYTPASLRDDLARHRGGFVWIDDPANVDDLGDLLRAAAGEGVHSRKGGVNWSEVIQTHLVAPIVLSAEGLEMLKERAMADRVIEFEVPSPVDRESQRGAYPQWDDVVTFMNRVGHMSRYAGHYVQRAFQWLDSVDGIDGLRQMLLSLRVGTGRLAEKLAMVRVGARCLQYVADAERWSPQTIDGWEVGGGDPIDFVGIVDSWAQGQSDAPRTQPYITGVVLPTYLASKGLVPGSSAAPFEPAFMDRNGNLRVNVAALAQWWMRHSRQRSDRDRAQQLGAPAALQSEAKMLKWESGNPIRGKRYVVVDINTTLGVLSEAGFDWTEALEAINNG